MIEEAVYVGVDVAKSALDVAVTDSGETWQLVNDDEGISQAVHYIASVKPAIRGYSLNLLSTSKADDLDSLQLQHSSTNHLAHHFKLSVYQLSPLSNSPNSQLAR